MIVTGNITEKISGEAVPYANVYISDAQGKSLLKTNTVGDENGRYSIIANLNDYLSVTFVGYKVQTAQVKSSTLNFVMSEVTPGEISEIEVKAKKAATRAQIFGALFILLGIGYIVTDSKILKP